MSVSDADPQARSHQGERDPCAGLSAAGAARRRFLIDTTMLTGGLAATPYVAAAEPQERQRSSAPPSNASMRVRLNVNGRDYELTVDPRVTLLDALREHLGLPGTKKGCDRGQCGACTVLSNGRRVNACLTLAVAAEGDRIVTVEGLARGDTLHPVQQAFVERDAYQCGYCTPGQVCSAVALLDEARAGAASAVTHDVRVLGPVTLTDDEIRERMSGNLCRCGAYVNIVAAVRDASHRGG
jgi:xanthine dehydrogenase YagT iron-sulfur-binding subunit